MINPGVFLCVLGELGGYLLLSSSVDSIAKGPQSKGKCSKSYTEGDWKIQLSD